MSADKKLLLPLCQRCPMQKRAVLLLAILPLNACIGCHAPAVNSGVASQPVTREEVRFTSGNLIIAGTITRPTAGPDRPGVVMLHAAGLHAREDYRAFADSLASRGIVVLAYDMRGTGDSEGEPRPATFEEQSEDARAALGVLRAQSDIEAGKVGLWALSRGGYVAPMLATAEPEVRFLVVVSSPALPVAVNDSSARVAMAMDALADAADIARAEHFVGHFLRAARNGGRDYARLQQEFSEASVEPWFSSLEISALPSEEWLTQYGRVLAYDPDFLWRRVRTPTLLIYGADDLPRLVQDSRARILSALAASGAHVDAPVFADADHLLRVSDPEGEMHFAKGFFDAQQRWITANAREQVAP